MKIAKRVESKGAQEFLDESEIEFVTDVWNSLRTAVVDKGTPAQIERDLDEGLIHGEEAGAIAVDSLLFTQGLGKGTTKNNPRVLYRVMEIDLDVSFRFDFQVETSMLRKEVEHVIEKGHPGRNRGFSRAIEMKPQGDIGLTGFSDDLAASRLRFFHEVRFASDRRSVSVYLFEVVLNTNFVPGDGGRAITVVS